MRNIENRLTKLEASAKIEQNIPFDFSDWTDEDLLEAEARLELELQEKQSRVAQQATEGSVSEVFHDDDVRA